MDITSHRLKQMVRRLNLSLSAIARRTEITRPTWRNLLQGATKPKKYHLMALKSLEVEDKADRIAVAREPWQRLPFPAPRCEKCGSRMHRVRRKIVDGKTLYAWRCAEARLRKCETARIWTNDVGSGVERPAQPINPIGNIGVIRPICDRCGRRMAGIGKRKNLIFGPLWKWRCVGTIANAHKSFEIVTNYYGAKVQVPHVRSWGQKLLPFERKRLEEIAKKDRLSRWHVALECCPTCHKPLQCDQRGHKRWRLHCQNRCIEPYFVNERGVRIVASGGTALNQGLPRKARKCPTCGALLVLSGCSWRKRSLTPHDDHLIRLVCVSRGRRRHRSATLYFNLSKRAFLTRRDMKPGKRRGPCPHRKRCCGKPMWATSRGATQREPAHWFLACANSSCTRGRGGKRRYLKIALDGKPLRWLKPSTPGRKS